MPKLVLACDHGGFELAAAVASGQAERKLTFYFYFIF
jgi:ethanolamine transporter EutH